MKVETLPNGDVWIRTTDTTNAMSIEYDEDLQCWCIVLGDAAERDEGVPGARLSLRSGSPRPMPSTPPE